MEELERVCEAGEWVRLREGQKLCTQGRVCSAIYVVAPTPGECSK